MKNKYCIIRGNSSGVFAGELVNLEGTRAEILNCRRLWFWDGACSLSELAQKGTSKPNKCKFTMEVDKVYILDTIEILECSEEAKENIKGVQVWKF